MEPPEPDVRAAAPGPRRASWWPIVVPALLVLATTTVVLLAGHPLQDALVCAAGFALIGNQVARRLVGDASPLPTVIVGSAVTAFGAVLVLMGYDLFDAALGAGLAGVVAGEVAGRLSASGPIRRTEV
ncbi:hypothetical protein [Asanoa siamensis]|uniref:Uncharacterized protein n=1 Tax=Asanoa siamensis TaxID=926357 RepID=A0ABQ4CR06_9ACTN|nr:hypothetical protein [Asanoa siamensis]GIF73701.1 hypothetical protein Asi02nite_32190 [Asanoa siamensis]